MDTPHRANAAQMAARNIKAARGGRHPSSKRPGTPARASLQDTGNQEAQWAPMPSADAPINIPSQTPGLFGGGLQASSSFVFTAPGDTLNFAKEKEKLGLNNSADNISDINDGIGRFAGDNRGGKRVFGGSTTSSSQNSVPTFKVFGSNPNGNAFGGSKTLESAANNPFSFNGPTAASPATPEINFNSPQPSPAKSTFVFGGTSQPTPASPGNSFGSNTNGDQAGNTSFNANPQPQGSIFNLGSNNVQPQQNTPFQFNSNPAPPANIGINFSNPLSTSAPTNSLFGNIQTSAPASSGMDFGSHSSAAMPMGNLFGTSTPPANPNPTMNFGPTPTSSAFPNLFGTPQASQPPTTSGLFGLSSQAPVTSTATSTLFGSISQPPTTSSLFEATSQPPASSPGLFAGFNSSSSPLPTLLYGNQQQAPPTNNFFSAQTSQAPQTNNLFGNLNPASSQAGISSQSVSAIAPSNSLFNSPNKPEARNNFFGAPAQEISQGGIVGNDNNSKSTNDLFGNLNKPVDASVTDSNVNGFAPTNLPSSSKLFGPSQPLFSTSSPSLKLSESGEAGDNSKNSLSEATNKDNGKPSVFSFGTSSSPTKDSSNSRNIFSASSSLDLPSSANQPPPSGMFPTLTQSATQQTSGKNPLSRSNDANMPIHDLDPLAGEAAMKEFSAIGQMPDSELRKDYANNPELRELMKNPEMEKQYFALCRLKELNKAMAKMFEKISWSVDPSDYLRHYREQRVEIAKAAGMYAGTGKRKEREEDSEATARPQKRSNALLKSIAQARSTQSPAANPNSETETDSNAESSKRVGPFGATSSSSSASNGAPYTNGSSQATSSQAFGPGSASPVKNDASKTISPSKNPLNPIPTANGSVTSKFNPFTNNSPAKNPFTTGPPKNIINSFTNPGAPSPFPLPSSSKGKRKAVDELTQDTEQVNPLRAIKTPKLNGSFSASDEGSSTSAIFKGILNSPSKLKNSPEKIAEDAAAAEAKSTRANPFGNLSFPKSPSMAESPTTTSPNLFKSDAPFQLQSDLLAQKGQTILFANKGSSALGSTNSFSPSTGSTTAPTNPFQFKPTAATVNGNRESIQTIKPPTFGSLSGMSAVEQFRKKAKQDAAAEEKKMMEEDKNKEWESDEEAESEYERKWYAKRAKDKQEKQEQKDNLKGAVPKFGNLSGSSAVEQFRQKAKQDEEVKERKKMEEDKNNEWESEEETESDYERKWYERRANDKTEKQEQQDNLKNAAPKFMFDPSRSASGSASKGQISSKSAKKDRDETTNSASTSLFAQYTSGNSAANSMNGSRTSTPGPIGSSTGSVLGGSLPGQPVKNIFGHLSDTGSGKDDQDDESDADDEEDSENKDPNYYPSAENGSGPGTPAEETGAGIASAKKSNLFGLSNGATFGTPSNSGSSTPGRSLFDRVGAKPVAEPHGEEKAAAPSLTGGLFDRISKDSNGNPLRHISSEEKENTQPSSTNVFQSPLGGGSSSFSRSSATPADQTWKQDSPIKFGKSANTEDQEPTPTLSFTAATPTKAPRNLFGTPTEASSTAFGNKASPFSGLLSNNGINNKGASSSSVGFAFGAGQSNSSSLFPSAAGSAATSRGTSPGATTDSASDADADPDAERHEQINLTAGGPGEEDEEVVHEVRAKALQFATEGGSNKWITAGLGPLRVLKHKETSVSRVLLRGDPSGKIVLNKGILGNLTYSAEGKTVKFLAADGAGLETFLLQVKTPEFAQKLAEVLNENKAK